MIAPPVEAKIARAAGPALPLRSSATHRQVMIGAEGQKPVAASAHFAVDGDEPPRSLELHGKRYEELRSQLAELQAALTNAAAMERHLR